MNEIQGRRCREEAYVRQGDQPLDGPFTQQSKLNDKPEQGLLERGIGSVTEHEECFFSKHHSLSWKEGSLRSLSPKALD